MLYTLYMRYIIYIYIWYGVNDIRIRDLWIYDIYNIYNLNSWGRGFLVKKQVFPTSFDLGAVFKGNYFVFKQSTEK